MKFTAKDVELAVAGYFKPRRNLICPNIHWGMGINHECDVFVLKKTGYAYEIEIKVSRGDLKKDLKKKRGHNSNKLRRLYFAIPEYLIESKDLIPRHAGILVIGKYGKVTEIRKAKDNKEAVRISDNERFHLAHLACMRIWKLKAKIKKLQKRQT
jgi:hypothetical protein